jgi:hypothetical protein
VIPTHDTLLSSEQQLKILEDDMVAKRERQARAFRYTNRRSVDELLKRVLNGDLFDMFNKVKDFPEVPL